MAPCPHLDSVDIRTQSLPWRNTPRRFLRQRLGAGGEGDSPVSERRCPARRCLWDRQDGVKGRQAGREKAGQDPAARSPAAGVGCGRRLCPRKRVSARMVWLPRLSAVNSPYKRDPLKRVFSLAIVNAVFQSPDN